MWGDVRGRRRTKRIFLGRKKVTMSRNAREGQAKGQSTGDLWEVEFEGLSAAIDVVIWFPRLRTERQCTSEIASSMVAHK